MPNMPLSTTFILMPVVAAAAATLTGCGAEVLPSMHDELTSTTMTSPTPKVGQEPVNASGSRYFADWVVLPDDGGKVLCVRYEYASSVGGSTMSCDWAHAQPGNPKQQGGLR